MNAKDLIGLEKPLVKLVEVFSEGSGVLGNHLFGFDAKKIKRIGRAEIEVEKEKIITMAEAHSEIQSIEQRAKNRFMLEQYNKQTNLDNIFVKTRDLLEGETVSEDDVERDWIFKFMNIAQDVSREEMQNVLSRMLAGEIRKPGEFSYRTLDIVKNLSKSDLNEFRNLSLISSINLIIILNKSTANKGFFDFKYSQIMYLTELGLIQPSMDMHINVKDSKISFNLEDRLLSFNSEKSQIGRLPIIKFTKPGGELASLLNIESEEDKVYIDRYIEELQKYFKNQQVSIVVS